MVKPAVCGRVNVGHGSNEPLDRRYIKRRAQFRTYYNTSVNPRGTNNVSD